MINKSIITCLLIIITLTGCSQNHLEEKRKNTMLIITNCIIQNDTSKLYKLIDTSFDKEGLDFDIDFLHRQLSKKQLKLTNDNFKVSENDKLIYSCKVNIDSKTIDYVDINFMFSPNAYDKVITVNKDVKTKGNNKIKSPNGADTL